MDKIPIQEKVLKILLDKKIELIKQMEALDTLYIITLSTRINEF